MEHIRALGNSSGFPATNRRIINSTKQGPHVCLITADVPLCLSLGVTENPAVTVPAGQAAGQDRAEHGSNCSPGTHQLKPCSFTQPQIFTQLAGTNYLFF